MNGVQCCSNNDVLPRRRVDLWFISECGSITGNDHSGRMQKGVPEAGDIGNISGAVDARNFGSITILCCRHSDIEDSVDLD